MAKARVKFVPSLQSITGSGVALEAHPICHCKEGSNDSTIHHSSPASAFSHNLWLFRRPGSY